MSFSLFNFLRLPLFFIGLATVFIVSRYYSQNAAETWGQGIGLGMMALGVMFALFCIWDSKKANHTGQAKSFKYAFMWQGLVFVGCLLAVLYNWMMGDKVEPDSAMLKVLLGAWLLFVLIGFFLGIGVELAIRTSGIGKFAEPKRIQRGAAAWLSIGLMTCLLVSVNYIAHKYNKAYDWSYLKVTQASEATKQSVLSVDEGLNIYLFYPHDNEVLSFLREYFDNIAGPNVVTKILDKDREPILAEKLKISRNGNVAIFKGSVDDEGLKPEKLYIGTKIASAREKLTDFDAEFRKLVMKIAKKSDTFYFTTGHGETTWKTPSSDELSSVKIIKQGFAAVNSNLKELTLSKGLDNKVPDDAKGLLIIAPTQPFLQSEVDSIETFLDGGGSVFVVFDPNSAVDETQGDFSAQPTGGAEGSNRPLFAMLAKKGITYHPEILGHETAHFKLRRGDGETWSLFTSSFSSHESVTNLNKLPDRLPLLFDTTGYLSIDKKIPDWSATETVRSKSGTFNDINKNGKLDGDIGEKQQIYVLQGVSEQKGDKNAENRGRLVVLADMTVISDGFLARSPANRVNLLDAINYLKGEVEPLITTEPTKDKKIVHSKKEDTMIFYSSVVGMPLLILLFGFFATRRKKRRNV